MNSCIALNKKGICFSILKHKNLSVKPLRMSLLHEFSIHLNMNNLNMTKNHTSHTIKRKYSTVCSVSEWDCFQSQYSTHGCKPSLDQYLEFSICHKIQSTANIHQTPLDGQVLSSGGQRWWTHFSSCQHVYIRGLHSPISISKSSKDNEVHLNIERGSRKPNCESTNLAYNTLLYYNHLLCFKFYN